MPAFQYPLDNWLELPTGYRFGQPTTYNNFHLGVDKGNSSINGFPVFAPSDGEVVLQQKDPTGKTYEGGNTVWFRDANNNVWRFMHLSRFNGGKGGVPRGTIIGFVGNTGKFTTGPHLHSDVSRLQVDINNRANFIDPEKYLQINIHTNMFENIKNSYKKGLDNPSVIKLIIQYDVTSILGKRTKTEYGIIRRFDDGSVKVRRNVGLDEFVTIQAGPVRVGLDSIKDLPTF